MIMAHVGEAGEVKRIMERVVKNLIYCVRNWGKRPQFSSAFFNLKKVGAIKNSISFACFSLKVRIFYSSIIF